MSRLTGNLFCGALLVSAFCVTPVLWTQEGANKKTKQVEDLFKKVDLKSQDEKLSLIHISEPTRPY